MQNVGLRGVVVSGAVAMLAAIVACSGSTSPLIGGDAGQDGATASDGGATTTYTLDNVCDLTAPKVCAQRVGCCTQSGGYDEAGCLTNTKADCAKNVAEVRAGTMTFDGSNIDACLAKLAPIVDKCRLEFPDLQSIITAFSGCRVFAGNLGEGVACERDEQCKPATTNDAFVSCSKTTHKCQTIRLLSAGANCAFKDGISAVCGSGLYCDAATSGANAGEGTCKTALALGAQCAVAQPFQCGLGAYCDGTTHQCTKSKPGGSACENVLQCASLKCEKTGDAGTGTCAPQEPLLKASDCGK